MKTKEQILNDLYKIEKNLSDEEQLDIMNELILHIQENGI